MCDTFMVTQGDHGTTMPNLAVILPAAGNSTRFGRNKLIEPVCGEPVLLRALRAFEYNSSVSVFIIATNDAQVTDLIRGSKLRVQICPGGATRAQSVRNALRA